jgi:hypothetical protein
MWRELDPDATGKIKTHQLKSLMQLLADEGNPIGTSILANDFKWQCFRVEMTHSMSPLSINSLILISSHHASMRLGALEALSCLELPMTVFCPPLRLPLYSTDNRKSEYLTFSHVLRVASLRTVGPKALKHDDMVNPKPETSRSETRRHGKP